MLCLLQHLPAVRRPASRARGHRHLASQPSATMAGSNRLNAAHGHFERELRCNAPRERPAVAKQTSPTFAPGLACRHFLRLRRARVLELKDTPSA
jgi:hypothetical protein